MSTGFEAESLGRFFAPDMQHPFATPQDIQTVLDRQYMNTTAATGKTLLAFVPSAGFIGGWEAAAPYLPEVDIPGRTDSVENRILQSVAARGIDNGHTEFTNAAAYISPDTFYEGVRLRSGTIAETGAVMQVALHGVVRFKRMGVYGLVRDWPKESSPRMYRPYDVLRFFIVPGAVCQRYLRAVGTAVNTYRAELSDVLANPEGLYAVRAACPPYRSMYYQPATPWQGLHIQRDGEAEAGWRVRQVDLAAAVGGT